MPTTTVSTQEAPAQLARLLAEVEAGGDVVIARDGTPVARLVRIEAESTEVRPPRRFGTGRGMIILHEGWDSPDFPAVRQFGTGRLYGHLNPGWESPDYTDEELVEFENASLYPDTDNAPSP